MTTIKYKQISSEFFGFVDNTLNDTTARGEYWRLINGNYVKSEFIASDVGTGSDIQQETITYWAQRIPVFVCPSNKVCKVKLMASHGTAFWRGNGGVDTGEVKNQIDGAGGNLTTYHHVYSGYETKLKLGSWNEPNTLGEEYGTSSKQIEVFVAPGDQIFWHPGERTNSGYPTVLGTLTMIIFEEDAAPAPRENKIGYTNSDRDSQQKFYAPFGTLD